MAASKSRTDSRALLERARVLYRNAREPALQRILATRRPVRVLPGGPPDAPGFDRRFRLAALNLIEDAEAARRSYDVEARERVRAEADARASGERYRSLFESIDQGFAVLQFAQGDMSILESNPAFARLVEHPEPTGRRFLDLIPADDSHGLEAYQRALLYGRPAEFEVRLGRRWLHLSLSAMPAQGPDRLALLVTDITRRKNAEVALRANEAHLMDALAAAELARSQAEAASRAKDHLLAVLSHELRTPLTPVLYAVELLELRADLPADVADAVAMIRRNIETEARLVDDLLEVTRRAHGGIELQRAPMRVHEAVDEAVAVAQHDIGLRKQALRVRLRATDDRVEGDFMRVQQAMWNLIKNASKFTAPGGSIEVVSRNLDGCIVVDVRDSGIGMEVAEIARVFEPFAQGNETISKRFGGVGLGLAIAKGNVEAHGGRILAASEGAGRGATFSILLPLASVS